MQIASLVPLDSFLHADKEQIILVDGDLLQIFHHRAVCDRSAHLGLCAVLLESVDQLRLASGFQHIPHKPQLHFGITPGCCLWFMRDEAKKSPPAYHVGDSTQCANGSIDFSYFSSNRLSSAIFKTSSGSSCKLDDLSINKTSV